MAERLDLPALHARAASDAAQKIAAVGPDQWDRPTPCDGWDTRTLANHVVSGNLWAAELASGRTIDDVGDRLDGDVLGPDPAAAAVGAAEAAAAAFSRPGAMDAPCAVSYGPVPGSVYCGHRIVDLVGHSWDVAVATGADAELDPSLVEAAVRIIVPQLEVLRASGMFGDAHDPGPGGDAQDRLLSLLGRQPR